MECILPGGLTKGSYEACNLTGSDVLIVSVFGKAIHTLSKIGEDLFLEADYDKVVAHSESHAATLTLIYSLLFEQSMAHVLRSHVSYFTQMSSLTSTSSLGRKPARYKIIHFPMCPPHYMTIITLLSLLFAGG